MKRLLPVFCRESAWERVRPTLASVGRALLPGLVAFGAAAGIMEHFHPTSVSAHFSFASWAAALALAAALAAFDGPRRESVTSRWLVAASLALAAALGAWLVFEPTPNLQPLLAAAAGLIVLAAPFAL